jgi:cyclopropane-fatty-acyl-phospholipid synthase
MDLAPVAPLPQLANEQHYEVPTAFFLKVLGKTRKYSCCHWDEGVTNLDMAEQEALRITCEHASLQDGMDILELGCGWGSLTLRMAKQYPHSRITAVSNSSSQREHIMLQALAQRLANIEVITCDMNSYMAQRAYDRVVSVEMFEHMRNYRLLFERISSWLKPGGRFFMHIFCHRDIPYAFEDQNATDWMSRHFFSGGMMPSSDLPLYFQDHLRIRQHWHWSGLHYEKTANAWLRNMDANRAAIWPILEQTYGADCARQWWMRWRMFFMACAELFACDNGQQWHVGHYLFDKATRR